MQTNFRKNTGTRSRGKQWTYSALSIFELCICEYDHLNHIRCSISRAPLNFIKCITLYIYIYLQILLLYSWPIYFSNRSVTLTNNACCFMKRYVVVKHMTAKKVYAIHNEKHCDFDTLRIRRMENV